MISVNEYNCLICLRHPGSFDGKDGYPYIGEKGDVAGKFSIAIDRRTRPSGKPINPIHNKFVPVTLSELAEYAKNREKYPHLRVRCKPNQIGTLGSAGRFLSEMKIDWDGLDLCVAATNGRKAV
ncbi:MAG: hypothetical protein D0531_05590 [Methylococcales bacterium]|nr:MAG: hypothetical protein D0531_05590 [Methylococcales bacterium]